MTIHASGFRVICNNCQRQEDLPALNLEYARQLEQKIGWRIEPGDADYCPDCEKQLEAQGKLSARLSK